MSYMYVWEWGNGPLASVLNIKTVWDLTEREQNTGRFFKLFLVFQWSVSILCKRNKAIRDGKYFAPPHASAWQRSPH